MLLAQFVLSRYLYIYTYLLISVVILIHNNYTYLIQLKGGEFPSLRYSDEETERLLAQAYAAIPPRAGKRGTRNLKRQRRRWEIKRQYDATKKQERMEEHVRRMAKRHEISQAMYTIRVEAGDLRERERVYQMGVVERWAARNGVVSSSSREGGVAKTET